MDLMDIEDHELYFDQPLPEDVKQLIQQAASLYHKPESERMLLEALKLEPSHPMVHVALYRYYYYKHRLEDALKIAERTLHDSGTRLGFSASWRQATLERLHASEKIMAEVRYYLLALKGAGFIYLRLGHIEEGLMRLQKVADMDAEDRLGTRSIIQVVENREEE